MNYKKVYMDYFEYGEQDYIPSEISGEPAADIHHIIYRSAGGSDEIENLIGLTRKEHDKGHDRSDQGYSEEYLREKHLLFMKNHGANN